VDFDVKGILKNIKQAGFVLKYAGLLFDRLLVQAEGKSQITPD